MGMNMNIEQMMKSHVFKIPTKIEHGIGIIEKTGTEVKELGVTRPLLVTDPAIYQAGVTKPVEQSLNQAGITPIVYPEVEANPPVRSVARGRTVYEEKGCDGLIAVGGGSSMDTAKAIGVEVAHGESVLEYEAAEGKKPLTRRIPPLVTIPTTAGTGSEVTQWAVITDEKRKYKFNTGGPLIAAHLTIIDPKLHVSMPPHVTAMTGVDALSHAIECYTMHYAQPITDAVALLAIEYVAKYLRRAYANGNDLEARYGMAQAAMLAGLSYGSESAGAAHAMAQTLGGMIPVPHGQCVAAMLGPVMEYNWMGHPEKFARIAKALGVDTTRISVEEAAKESVRQVYRLVDDLNIPTLAELGVDKKQIPQLAKAALNDPQTVGNPRDLDVSGYEWIYKRCFDLVPKTV